VIEVASQQRLPKYYTFEVHYVAEDTSGDRPGYNVELKIRIAPEMLQKKPNAFKMPLPEVRSARKKPR
jgi:hypothetical protein